jgi:hypothetical protein
MVAPFVLFVCSLAVAGYAFFTSGAVLSDLMLLAIIMSLASLFLLLRGFWVGRGKPAAVVGVPANWVLVDGSNVMHWKDGLPQLQTVREVVWALEADGYSVGVVFDANAGYKISDRYQDDYILALQLGVSAAQVFVVPKGTQADPHLLSTARKMRARVVTNDRFRDWAKQYPEVARPGFLIWGGYQEGKLWLSGGVKPLAVAAQ